IKANIGGPQGLEEAVIRLVSAYGLERRAFISSFNHYSLWHLHELAPELPTAILYSEPLFEPWEYAGRIGAQALHPQFRTVTAALVTAAQAAGVSVRPWTVDEEADLERLLAAGVDAVITNRVDR